ncbi:MAG: OmpH family outer membrane protein [Rickettsiales bacterium]|jgi:Skp family chaperone for outer membrane proteins|nr:OmpH family outer membrane protein [Rickettsiales bacterium]
MKKNFLLSLFVVLSIVSVVSATEFATLKVEEVIKNSTAMEKVNKEIEKKKKEIEKDLQKEEKDLATEKESLEREINVLDKDVAEKKIQKFQEKVVKFQTKVKDSESNLQQANINAVNKILENIKAILSEMKNEKGSTYVYDIVLPTSTVVFVEKGLDISGEVLTRLNKKYKEVKVEFKK